MRTILTILVAGALGGSMLVVAPSSAHGLQTCGDVSVMEADGGSGLVAAIAEANQCIGPQVLTLEPGRYEVPGALSVTDDLTLAGLDPARLPTVHRTSSGTVFSLAGGVEFTVRDLQVTGPARSGLLFARGATIALERVTFVGAAGTCGVSTPNAIQANGVDLVMRSTTISGSGCSGVAAFNGSSVDLDDVDIVDNGHNGLLIGGRATITNSRIHGNGNFGITTESGPQVQIVGSHVYGNGADGISQSSGSLTISSSTIGLTPASEPAGNGQIGLDLSFVDVILDTVEVAHNADGIRLGHHGNHTTTVQQASIHDNVGSGVHLSTGRHAFSNSTITANGTDCTFGTGTLGAAAGNTDSDGSCGFAPANQAPTAVLADLELNEGDGPVVLDASASSDPDGDELTFAWSANVVPSGSEATLTATDNEGEHVVTVEVCDSALACSEAMALVTVRNVAPQLEISGPETWTANFGESIVVAIDDPGASDTHRVAIAWGDDHFDTIDDATDGVTASHVYTDPRTFTISVEVRDDAGDGNSSTHHVTVVQSAVPSTFALSASLDAATACTPPATDIAGVATTELALPPGWAQGAPEIFYCLRVTNNSADVVSQFRLDGDYDALEGIYDLSPALAAGMSRTIDLGSQFEATGSLHFDVTLADENVDVASGMVAIAVDAPTVDGAIESWTTAASEPGDACNDNFSYRTDGTAVGVASVPVGVSEMWLCVSLRNNADAALQLHEIDADPEFPEVTWPGVSFTENAEPGETVNQIIGPVTVELPDGAPEAVHSVVWRSIAPPHVELFSDLSRMRFVAVDDLPRITIEPASALEGDAASSAELSFRLTLRSPAGELITGPASVLVQTVGGSAVLGADYVPGIELIEFVDDAEQFFTVQLVGDDVHEADEQLTIVLSQVIGAIVDQPTVTGSILDDDGPVGATPLAVRVGRTADLACIGELDTTADVPIGRLQLPVGASAEMPLFYCVTYTNTSATPQSSHLVEVDGVDTADLPFSVVSNQTIAPGGSLTRILGPMALRPMAGDDQLIVPWTWRAFADNVETTAQALSEVSVSDFTGDLGVEASIWLHNPADDCGETEQDSVLVPHGQGPGSSSFQAWYCVVVTNDSSATLVTHQVELETDELPRIVPVSGVVLAGERRTVVLGPFDDHPSPPVGGAAVDDPRSPRRITWTASGPGYVPGLDDDIVVQADASVSVIEDEAPDLVRLDAHAVVEGGTVTIELTRGIDLTGSMPIYLVARFTGDAIAGDSCSGDADFILEPAILTELTAVGALPTLEVVTCDDDLPEPNEKFSVAVHALGDGGGLGDRLATAEVTIVDNGDIVRLDVIESDDFDEEFVVSIPLPEPAEQEAAYQMLVTGELTFGPCGFGTDMHWGPPFNADEPNQPDFIVEVGASAMEFEIDICGDGYPEPTEAATIHVVEFEGDGTEVARWELTVEDEDPFPVLRGVDVDDEWEDLGSANSAFAKFEVVTAAEIPWSFDLSISGPGAGVCGFGANYQPPLVPVVIVDFAEDEFELPVGSCRDAVIEADYTVDMQLVARDTYAAGQDTPAVSTVLVQDDDEPPVLPTVTQLVADEGSGGGTTVVGVSIPVDEPARAPEYQYHIRSVAGLGLAVGGATCVPLVPLLPPPDHRGVVDEGSVRTLTHADTTIDFEVEICADSELEPNRIAWFEIWDVQDVHLLASIALTIVDDDGAPKVRMFDAEVIEGSATEALPPLLDDLPSDLDNLPSTIDELADAVKSLISIVELRVEVLEPPTREYLLTLRPSSDPDNTAQGLTPLRPFCDPTLLGPPDFAWTHRSFTVSPEDTGQIFQIPVFGACADILIEDDEIYSVEVVGEVGDVLDQATVTIIDDDSAPVIEMNDQRVLESIGTLDFEVDLLTPAHVPVWLRFIDGTAHIGTGDESDYRPFGDLATQPLPILPGAVGTSIVQIGIVDGQEREPDEFFTIEVWDSPIGGSRLASARVTIQDDDRPPQVRIKDVKIVEGTAVEFFPGIVDGLPTSIDELEAYELPEELFSLVTSATIEVEITDAPLRPYTVIIDPITGPNDTAIGLSSPAPFCDPSGLIGAPDFFWDSREIQVLPSDEGEIFELDVYIACADSAIEADETYTVLALDEGSNRIEQATVTVVNDDSTPVVTGADVSVTESVGIATVTFEVSTPANIPLWVRTASDTAVGNAFGGDFLQLVATSLPIIPGGTGPAELSVVIVDDGVVEADETFDVEVWDAPVGGSQVAVATVTIIDNDRAPQIELLDVDIDEGSFTNFIPPSSADLPDSLDDLPMSWEDLPDPLKPFVSRGSLLLRVVDAPARDYQLRLEPIGASSDTAVGLGAVIPFCDPTGVIGIPDYVWTSQLMTVTPNDGGEILEVDVLMACRDLLIEGNEFYTIRARDEHENVLDTATITIIDDDSAPVITSTDVTVSENVGIASITFDVTSPVQVPAYLRTVSESAEGGTGGGDFLSYDVGAPFPSTPGATGSVAALVPIVDDLLVEGDETFRVEVWDSPVGGNQLATSTVTITDNDVAEPTINDPNRTDVFEGNTVTVVFDVAQTPNAPYPVAIGFDPIAGNPSAGLCLPAGLGGDVFITPGAVIPGGGDTLSVDVTACGDGLVESTERFDLIVSTPTGTELARAEVRIIDADSITVSIEDAWISEGDSDPNAKVTISVGGDLSSPVDVAWSAKELASTSSLPRADAPADFDTVQGALSFTEAGAKTIEVPINDDTNLEGQEWFRVTISSPAGDVVDGTGLVRIGDDERATINVGNASNILEGDVGTTPLVFPVTLSHPPIGNLTVHLGTHDRVDSVLLPDATDFASPGDDYTSTGASVVFTPGGPLTKFVEVPVKGNAALEDDRSVYLVAWGYSPSDLSVIESGSGQGYIFDDDDPPVISGAENIYVTLKSAGLAMRIYYEPTATDIQDFSVPVECDPASGSLFPVGQTVVTCTATDSSGKTDTDAFLVIVTENDQQKVAIPQGPDITSAIPNEPIQLVAGGFAAHSRVELEIRSNPIPLGSAIADERGLVDVVLTIPPYVPPGEHTLVASGRDASGRAFRSVASLFIGTDRPVPSFTG